MHGLLRIHRRGLRGSPPQRRYPRQVPERTALYRRYRPQTFSAIVGQDHVTRTLRNAIASGQVAHAYLLAGVRGTGKTSIARLIAKAVNCPNAKDGEPCDRCETCVAIRDGRFLDLIEIDAASNRGIDEMRDLRDKVRFAPGQGQYKVYVIDEAHQLTTEAFNALLKTLEEPPPHAIFVLATTESGKIPATIVSRTQRFDLRRIPHKGAVEQLRKICEQEGLTAEPAALEAIARHAQGSLRDAESILDMVAAFAKGAVTLADVDALLGSSDWEETSALFDALAAKDGAKGITLVGRLVDDGRDLRLFVRRAIDHARALVLVRATGNVPETASEQVAATLRAQSPKLSLDQLAKIAKRLVETEQHLRTSEGTPLPLELAILDLVTDVGGLRPPAPDERAGRRDGTAPEPSRPAPASARPIDPRGTRATAPERTPVVDLASRRVGANDPPATGARPPAVALDAVRRAWTELVDRTRERSVGKAAQLSAAEPVAIDGATVVIGFDTEFARAFWQDKLRPQLEQDLSEILTVAVRVRCVRQPGTESAPPDDPMLRAALETLGRPERIMEIE
ncbi:MAG: DNA polymerase III subunit gamma/tau [Chloroflexi bacterium]|nr:MAG: DNA polymerase III subunit gamma/tau [Chloroflexota bacterium]